MRTLNIKELATMSIEQYMRPIRKFFLQLRINNYYRHLEHFKRDADHANHGAKYMAKMIVNAEVELKEFDQIHDRRKSKR